MLEMDFKSFLQSCTKADFWILSKIFCFTGSDFCPLFFNNLFDLLRDRQLLPYPKQKGAKKPVDPGSNCRKNLYEFPGWRMFYKRKKTS